MTKAIKPETGRILAEILRLQRWAGGEAVDAARLFGLMHGFETALRSENGGLITEEAQKRVVDMLDEVDRDPASASYIDARLRAAGIGRDTAIKVMELCRLQGRFTNAIKEIASAPHAPAEYRSLEETEPGPESQWFGALHYLELVDCTKGIEKKLHAVFSPGIPRIGEFIEPERGSSMEVVDVRYVAIRQTGSEYAPLPMLVPYVYLRAIDEEADD
jgi:hypothetical protein